MDDFGDEGHLDAAMKKAKALLIGSEHDFPLSHDMTRFIQKVPVVGFINQAHKELRTGDTVNVRSDGYACIAEKTGGS